MTRPRHWLVVVSAPMLAACNGDQSALSPHGAAASSIATLTFVLSTLMVTVFMIVLIVTWLAIRGPANLRSHISERRTIVVLGIVFPTLVLTGLLIYGLWLMRPDTATNDYDVQIDVSGEQWWWRVRYRLPDGQLVESANEIRLPVGHDVTLALSSPDVIHSLWIPSLAGKVDMIPGRRTKLRLRADRAGIYRGACAEYCGGPHALMALHVVAMPAWEFGSWLNGRLTRIDASDGARHRGLSLFLGAGCGGCHAVDGTEARGTIGPNLTGLGLRRSIGAGLLPMSHDSIASFVRDGQQLKPGNKMPPFDTFSQSQLADLASYLLSLR